MRGDRVEILVDVGGNVREFEVTATRAGRRVEVSFARGTVEVSEVTLGAGGALGPVHGDAGGGSGRAAGDREASAVRTSPTAAGEPVSA